MRLPPARDGSPSGPSPFRAWRRCACCCFASPRSATAHGSSKRKSRSSKTGYRYRKPSSRSWKGSMPGARKPGDSSERPAPCRRRIPCRSSSPHSRKWSAFPGCKAPVSSRRRNRCGKEPYPSGRHPFRPSRQFPAACPPAERTAVAFRHGIPERHPFRSAPRIFTGDLGHIHAAGQHPAALIRG